MLFHNSKDHCVHLLILLTLQNNVELNPSKASCNKEPSSILNRETHGKDIARASHPNILPNDKTFETTSDNIYQVRY